MSAEPLVLPAIAGVFPLYPREPFAPVIGRRQSTAARDAARGAGTPLVWLVKRDFEGPVASDNLWEIGSLVRVGDDLETDGPHKKTLCSGTARCRLRAVLRTEPYLEVRVDKLPHERLDATDVEHERLQLQRWLMERLEANRSLDELFALGLTQDVSLLCDRAAFREFVLFEDLGGAEFLQLLDPRERLAELMPNLAVEDEPLPDVPELWAWSDARATELIGGGMGREEALGILIGESYDRRPEELTTVDLALGVGRSVRRAT